jgi:hypothetical protein
MKTIAQQLNVKEFPFQIKDKRGNLIYSENSSGYWVKWEYDENGNEIYFEDSSGFWRKSEWDENINRIYYENSNGYIMDNRAKDSCNGKVVEIDGKKYKLTEI